MISRLHKPSRPEPTERYVVSAVSHQIKNPGLGFRLLTISGMGHDRALHRLCGCRGSNPTVTRGFTAVGGEAVSLMLLP